MIQRIYRVFSKLKESYEELQKSCENPGGSDLKSSFPWSSNVKLISPTDMFTLRLELPVLKVQRVLLVQSSRSNCISRVELWRNPPFNGELPGFEFGGFPVRSSTAFIQNPAKHHENVHIKVELPVLKVQRALPHDLTRTVQFEQDLSLI